MRTGPVVRLISYGLDEFIVSRYGRRRNESIYTVKRSRQR
jgi:hypothetical protein